MSKTVLIVENDAPLSHAMRDSLSARGFTVKESSDGKGCADLMRRDRPDLLVLAVDLAAGQNGYIICGKLKKDEDLRGTPIIIVGDPKGFANHKKLKTCADDYVAKPFQGDAIVDPVGKLIGFPEAPTGPDESFGDVLSSEELKSEEVNLEPATSETTLGGDPDLDMIDRVFDDGGSAAPAHAAPPPPAAHASHAPAAHGKADAGELRALKSRVAELTAALDDATTRAQEHEAKARELESQLESRTTELEASKSAGSTKDNKEVFTLREQGTKKDKEILKLKSELNQKDQSIVELQEKQNALERQLSEVSEQSSQKDAQIKTLTGRADHLASDKKKVDSQLAQAKDESRAVTARLTTLQTDFDAQTERVASLEGELDAARSRAQELEGQLSAAQGELSDVRGELSTAQGELSDVRGELSTAQSELEKAQGELAELRSELDGVKAQLESRVSELEESRAEAQAAKSELEVRNSELDETRNQLEEARGQTETLQVDLDSAKSQLTSQATAFAEETSAHRKKVQGLEGQLRRSEDRANRLSGKVKADGEAKERAREALKSALDALGADGDGEGDEAEEVSSEDLAEA